MVRSETKWNKAFGKILARLISYIWFAKRLSSTLMCWRSSRIFLQIKSLTGLIVGKRLARFKINIWRHFALSEKKQTSVSHSRTDAEIISMDAGSRMGGLPALLCGIVL